MKRMTFINYMTMLLMIMPIYLFGQDYGDQKINFLSPTTMDFMKYGNLPLSHYTGQTSINIPLYTYHDNDFNIPISLNYSTQGCIPSKRPGLNGLDWYLVFGGAITREVKGLPDDYYNPPFTMDWPGRLRNGFWVGVNKFAKYNPESVFTAQSGIGVGFERFDHIGSESVHTFVNMGYDYEPDIFNFSFGKYSGYFFFDNSGSIRVCSKDSIKVDISGFKEQLNISDNNYNRIVTPSEIKLITPDGFKYYFGGDVSSLEYSTELMEDNNTNKNETVVAWHLSKIIAPNGKEAKYYYYPFDGGTSRSTSFYLTKYFDYKTIDYRTHDYLSFTNINVDDIKRISKIVYPDSIRIGETLISFYKSLEKETFYLNEYYDNKNLQLDSIKVLYKNEMRSHISFKYFIQSRRRFLSEIKKNGENKYEFLYQSPELMPDPTTKSIDHWGFYRGIPGKLIPDMQLNKANGDVDIVSDSRDAIYPYCGYGSLIEIKYPTGGYSIIDYEPHSYSKRLDRKASSQFYPALEQISGIAGGVRVKKITDYDQESHKLSSKTYFYVKNYSKNEGSFMSSGILLDYPRYAYYHKRYLEGYKADEICVELRSSSLSKNYNLNEPYIHYSEVVEMFENGSYSIHKYTNYETNPDVKDVRETKIYSADYYKDVKPSLDAYCMYYQLKDLNSCREERGKLQQLLNFNANGDTLYKVINAYNKISTTGNYAVGLRSIDVAFTYKIYGSPSLLKQTEETFYDLSTLHPIKKETNYTYNSYNLLSELSSVNSDGHVETTSYKYPFDFLPSTLWAAMVEKNMINKPVEIVHKKDNVELDRVKFDYTYFPGVSRILLTLPSVIWKSVGGGAREKELSYNSYDLFGNITDLVPRNNIQTVYLWAYNNQYPVAEIKGKTYDEVRTALGGQPVIDNLSTNTSPDITSLSEKLRTAFKSDAVLVTCYEYKPLVGIKMSIDPRGVKTSYEYDDFGRLKWIKDGKDNILETHDYHYQNQ